MKDTKIVFFADNHSYWFGNKKLKSVGYYIKHFFPSFDEEYWLTHGAFKELYGDEYKEHYRSFKQFKPDAASLFAPFIVRTSPKLLYDHKLKLMHAWERERMESAYRGTNMHSILEDASYNATKLKSPWKNKQFNVQTYQKEFDNESISLDLMDLKDGVYLELLVFDLSLGVAGQADVVFIETINGKRYVDINDYKTNKTKPSKSAPNYCSGIFAGEYASNHFKYEIQINSYAYLLSMHGFIPRKLAYTHFKNYDVEQATLVNLRNLQPKVKEMFSQNLLI